MLAATEPDFYSLPQESTLDRLYRNTGAIPVNVSAGVWWTPADFAKNMAAWQRTPASSSGFTAWLSENRTAVFVGAGVLLAVALFRPGR